MFLRIKNKTFKKNSIRDFLKKYNNLLPNFQYSKLKEYDGIIIDIDSSDQEEFMEKLEEFGFNADADEDE